MSCTGICYNSLLSFSHFLLSACYMSCDMLRHTREQKNRGACNLLRSEQSKRTIIAPSKGDTWLAVVSTTPPENIWSICVYAGPQPRHEMAMARRPSRNEIKVSHTHTYTQIYVPITLDCVRSRVVSRWMCQHSARTTHTLSNMVWVCCLLASARERGCVH